MTKTIEQRMVDVEGLADFVSDRLSACVIREQQLAARVTALENPESGKMGGDVIRCAHPDCDCRKGTENATKTTETTASASCDLPHVAAAPTAGTDPPKMVNRGLLCDLSVGERGSLFEDLQGELWEVFEKAFPGFKPHRVQAALRLAVGHFKELLSLTDDEARDWLL